MNRQDVDPAPAQEHVREQILELLRHIAREVVRRIATANERPPTDADPTVHTQGSTESNRTR